MVTGEKNSRHHLDLPEYDEESWPQSVKHYRIDTSFWVTAHSERQAVLRFREFQEVLMQLLTLENGPHDLVRYVSPDAYGFSEVGSVPPERITQVDETVLENRPQDFIGSSYDLLYSWMDPYSDDDFDPVLAAQYILASSLGEGEEVENDWGPMSFDDEIGPDGIIS